MPDVGSVDAAQALLWRISVLADLTPTDEPGEPPFSAAPLDPGTTPSRRPPRLASSASGTTLPPDPPVRADAVLSGPADQHCGAGSGGRCPGPWRRRASEQTDTDVNRMFTRAMAWQECPISRDRMIEINQMALSYFRSQFSSSSPGDRPTSPTGSART